MKFKDLSKVVKDYRSDTLTDLVGAQTEEAFVSYLKDRLGDGWTVLRSRKGSVADVYYKVDVLAVRFQGEEIADCLPAQVKSSREAAEAVLPKLVDVEDYPCVVPLHVYYPDESGRGFKEVCHDQ